MPYNENGYPAEDSSARIDAIAGRGMYAAVLLLMFALFPVGFIAAIAANMRGK